MGGQLLAGRTRGWGCPRWAGLVAAWRPALASVLLSWCPAARACCLRAPNLGQAGAERLGLAGGLRQPGAGPRPDHLGRGQGGIGVGVLSCGGPRREARGRVLWLRVPLVGG